jgi:hypothetical protein
MPDAEQSTTPASPSTPGDETLSTSLNKRWVLKMLAFLLAMLILGVWGSYDALILYPQRGLDSAEYLQMKYLEEADKTGAVTLSGVKAPSTELKRLKETTLSEGVDLARFRWLESLSMVRRLDTIEAQLSAGQAPTPGPDTSMPDAPGKLAELRKKWASKNQPAALSPFDIPVQYLFMVIGLGLAAYIVFFLLKCRSTKYRYQPAVQRLTLPTGKSFVPADIEDIDRRLWHKFFVELKVKELGQIKLDLLRYSPLEEWFLEMEKASPGYVPPEEEKAEEPALADAPKDGAAASE